MHHAHPPHRNDIDHVDPDSLMGSSHKKIVFSRRKLTFIEQVSCESQSQSGIFNSISPNSVLLVRMYGKGGGVPPYGGGT